MPSTPSTPTPCVTPFFHRGSQTLTYVVADPATRRAAIIDPCLDFDMASGRTGVASATEVLNHVRREGLTVEWILETHAHADHLSAAAWLKPQFAGARIGIGAGITDVQKTFRPIFNLGEHFPVDGSQFDRLFADGERFAIGHLDAEVIAVPGHTRDSIAYRVGDAVFVGDSLFMPDGGTARCDFPGGDAATLYRSIRERLYVLPDGTRVFVCHDYQPDGREVCCETTIGEQRRANIHVRDGVGEAEFVAMRTTRDATLAVPALILPSVQVNIRAGELPPQAGNGVRYLVLPLDADLSPAHPPVAD
jgi:glyoxylase-like metal-dependent hydrolase (beta-lactamase superfamily II)